MTYEKGTFAFFDGTSSDYKKALKLTDVIAGYKVTNIAPNGVKLASGTNALELSVGDAVAPRGGRALAAVRPGRVLCGHADFNLNERHGLCQLRTPTSGGAESDIIKKLMQKREQE